MVVRTPAVVARWHTRTWARKGSRRYCHWARGRESTWFAVISTLQGKIGSPGQSTAARAAAQLGCRPVKTFVRIFAHLVGIEIIAHLAFATVETAPTLEAPLFRF